MMGEFVQKGKNLASDVASNVDQASRDAIKAAEKKLAELRKNSVPQDHLKQIPVDEY